MKYLRNGKDFHHALSKGYNTMQKVMTIEGSTDSDASSTETVKLRKSLESCELLHRTPSTKSGIMSLGVKIFQKNPEVGRYTAQNSNLSTLLSSLKWQREHDINN